MIPRSLRWVVSFFLVAGISPAAARGADAAEPVQPVPLKDAVSHMTMPEGFHVTLFVGEPDVVQPIAMTTDERGRVWVVESLAYPDWQTRAGPGRDRVVILEDRDHNGRFDRRQVFWDKGRNLAGIVIGLGGVWLTSAPELIFIPDRNRDDVPDGDPEVLLDGWTLDAKHNIVNGLAWGPDGWLYGCHGILADSVVGRPGAPASERVRMNCGVWRYHPIRRTFEVVAHGTTNPWGIAFDDFGQMFVANCVIKHLFHIIPGARYERMYGQDDNPYAFRLIESCADHIHWAGGFWKTEGAEHAQNDSAGGGHAHCGALVYLGDTWPDRYRNTFFTLNIHGHRINNDSLERRGSGYVSRHRPDFLRANDPWFRGVSLIPSADGNVFMSDWSDAGECHDYEDIHRENGRIYKISYGQRRNAPPDLSRVSDGELVSLQQSQNDWLASRARVLLQERREKLSPQTVPALLKMLREERDVRTQLRSLWALHVIGFLDDKLALDLLASPSDWLRAWTVQLSLDSGSPPQTNRIAGQASPSPALLAKFSDLAASDSSPMVRLYLASALQRLAFPDRTRIATGLVARAEDAADPNLPLMIWYGIEPMVSKDDTIASALLAKAQIPTIRQFIAQRLALRLSLEIPANALRDSSDGTFQRDVLNGMFEALNGRRELRAPASWPAALATLARHSDADVQEKALLLSVVFGNAEAIDTLRRRVLDATRPEDARERALQALTQARVAGLVPLLQTLVGDRVLRAVAIRGLAAFDDPATPKLILEQYPKLTAEEKNDAIETLSSRQHFAIALLEAVKQGVVPARDISPFAARQIQALRHPRIPELMGQTLGEIRDVGRAKAVEIARYKRMLTPEAIQKANPSRGRAVFNRACGACHTLFDQGGTLAPELTGSQRSNLDYILENVVDPNAIVWNRYRASYFETADDRLISGIVLKENESTVTIQTQAGIETLPRNEIVTRRESTLSMMPEGLFESLTEQEILDLVAYLQSPTQVPLPNGSPR